MATTVSVTDGITYGFKLLSYFLGLSILGGAIVSVGSVIAASGMGNAYASPDIGVVAVGGLVSLVGVSVIYAGVLGVGYKVIADAVYTGNVDARED